MELGRRPVVVDGPQCTGLSVRARALSQVHLGFQKRLHHDVTLIIDDKDALYGT